MNGLIALGAGIAALTGIGGGIGIGIATGKERRQSPVSPRHPARSRPTCCWALLWQKVLQFSASSLHC